MGECTQTILSVFFINNSTIRMRRNNKRNFRKRNKRRSGGGAKASIRGPAPLVSGAGQAGLSTVVERFLPLFPPRVKKVLRYSGNAGLISTSGVVASYVLRATDLYDPDYTGTGHQPMGFDQMMVFYEHFVVTRAKLTVNFNSASGSAQSCCIRVDANNTPITVIDQILEFGGLVRTELGSIGNYGAQKTLSLSLNCARFQGVDERTITLDPNLRGDVASSPTENTYFHIQIWNAAAVTATCNISFLLEQEAWFTEPRTFSESLSKRLKNVVVQEAKTK